MLLYVLIGLGVLLVARAVYEWRRGIPMWRPADRPRARQSDAARAAAGAVAAAYLMSDMGGGGDG